MGLLLDQTAFSSDEKTGASPLIRWWEVGWLRKRVRSIRDSENTMGEKLTAILDELRRRLEVLHGELLVQMILFGSQARGDAEPDWEVDILVVLKDPVDRGEEINRTIDLTVDLSIQHDEVISCVFIGEDRFAHRHGPLLRNIRREGSGFHRRPARVA
jgi:uncharacterized protein